MNTAASTPAHFKQAHVHAEMSGCYILSAVDLDVAFYLLHCIVDTCKYTVRANYISIEMVIRESHSILIPLDVVALHKADETAENQAQGRLRESGCFST